MNRIGWFLAGVFAAAIMALAAAAVFVGQAHGFSALGRPSAMERWIAQSIRSMALPGGAKERTNPALNSQEGLLEARAHWADHCAICHANNGGGDTEMGKHMYPPAPDMRLPLTQNRTDGELFFIIENGVRMTGMPAWGGTNHDEMDSWKLVRFIRYLPRLSAQDELDMQKLNPKSPDELKEEQEENEFLNGGTPHEHAYEHH
jgi:mono/diheme cytochrome c family protein